MRQTRRRTKGEEGEEESAMHQVIVYICSDQGKGRKSIVILPPATVCLTADDTAVTSWLHPRVYMIGGNICAVWPLAHCTQLEATRKTEDFCATVLFWVLCGSLMGKIMNERNNQITSFGTLTLKPGLRLLLLVMVGVSNLDSSKD